MVKYFDSRNLVVGLKAIGTSVVASVWMIPILIARYIQNTLNLPLLGLVVGLFSVIGYIHTWGFLSRYFWRWR